MVPMQRDLFHKSLMSWFDAFDVTSTLRCICGFPRWHRCNGKRLDTFPITLNAIHVGYNAQVYWRLRTSWELGTLEVLVWDSQLFFLFAPLSPLDWPLEFVVISDHQTKYHCILEFKSKNFPKAAPKLNSGECIAGKCAAYTKVMNSGWCDYCICEEWPNMTLRNVMGSCLVVIIMILTVFIQYHQCLFYEILKHSVQWSV